LSTFFGKPGARAPAGLVLSAVLSAVCLSACGERAPGEIWSSPLEIVASVPAMPPPVARRAGRSGDPTTIDGGELDVLRFAIIGDTRPALIDDTGGYPTTIITRIWQDVEAFSPHPAFAVTTGDYVFARPSGRQADAQLDIYMQARSVFSGTEFPVMGNHECTGATTSNCGPGNADGVTNNYSAFLQKMLGPLGVTLPYYEVRFRAKDGTWTAKLLFLAANAWDSAQESWFSREMKKSTTYTFVVRHEGSPVASAPGVVPSERVLWRSRYTLAIVGHNHTFAYFPQDKEVVVGNGGAPLTGPVDYGYIIAEQRQDGAVRFRAYDAWSSAVRRSFAVDPDGIPVP
jgi:hypothetical protein